MNTPVILFVIGCAAISFSASVWFGGARSRRRYDDSKLGSLHGDHWTELVSGVGLLIGSVLVVTGAAI